MMPTLIDYFQEERRAAEQRVEAAKQRAEAAKQRAEAAKQRAEAAEQDLQDLNQKVQTVLAYCSQRAANDPLASQIVQILQA